MKRRMIMFCKNCGTPLADDAKFCGKCGTATANAAAPVQNAAPVVNPTVAPTYVAPQEPTYTQAPPAAPVYTQAPPAAPVYAQAPAPQKEPNPMFA